MGREGLRRRESGGVAGPTGGAAGGAGAAFTSVVAVAVSSAWFGSLPLAVTWATALTGPAAVPTTVRCAAFVAPDASVPNSQWTLPRTALQSGSTLFTSSEVGRLTVASTSSAAAGPALPAVTV